MFCSACGAQNVQGDKFCSNCGAPLASVAPAAAVCAQCGTPAVPGQAFCRRCGTRLPGAAATAAPVDARSQAAVAPSPPSAPVPAAPRKKAGSGVVKGLLKVVVPIAALIVSYSINSYVTKNYTPMLVSQFGDVSRQVVPMVIFAAIGGVAYKIVQR